MLEIPSKSRPMPSEPTITTNENMSEIDGGPTQAQGDVNCPGPSMSTSVDPVPQSAEPKVHGHDDDMVQEQKVAEHDATHTLLQGDLSNETPIPERSESLKNKMPRPDGDPYEYLLKPMLKTDTDQCTAWKDEVQNILIFAGLFSAVVTAFIIESYQRLQPDSNDAIVGLLAHIADRLDNAPNKFESISSIIANTGFSPSRSDININVFWFISLILSLTAALIGIITLQWLREHQRYDSALKPRETMAILNARLHSFEQWYVPQIFAGLPLLLQGALVLFFAGMIEFLFALRLEVAIPVTVAICVPLIFLIATTILPLLQLVILQDPFRLSINNRVPSPCPYKSPQSLIARRVGLGSYIFFWLFAPMVAGAYICVVKIACFIQKHTNGRLPIFHSQRPNLKLRLQDDLPRSVRDIRYASGDWISIDTSWLKARTNYALSLQMVYRDDNDLVVSRTGCYFYDNQKQLPELYDCTSCFHKIVHQNRANADLLSALCECIAPLCSWAANDFSTLVWGAHTDLVTFDLYFAFGQLARYDPPTAEFIEDVISDKSLDNSQTLYTAFMVAWIGAITYSWDSEPLTWARWKQVANQLVVKRLGICPERLFPMSSGDTWLPAEVIETIRFLPEEDPARPVLTRQQILAFLKGCSTMKPNSQLVIRPGPAKETYKGISAYMKVIVALEKAAETHSHDTFAHLTELCDLHGPQNLIQEKPFLLIAACFYLDAAATWTNIRGKCEPLLEVILISCATAKGEFIRLASDGTEDFHGWTGLDDAINAIYNHHNPSHQPTSNPNSFTSPFNPNGNVIA